MKILLLLNKGKKNMCKIKFKMYDFVVVILPHPHLFSMEQKCTILVTNEKDYKQEK